MNRLLARLLSSPRLVRSRTPKFAPSSLPRQAKKVEKADAHTRSIQIRRIALQNGIDSALAFAHHRSPLTQSRTLHSSLSSFQNNSNAGKSKGGKKYIGAADAAMWCTLLDLLGHRGLYDKALRIYSDDVLGETGRAKCGDRATVSVLNAIAEHLKTSNTTVPLICGASESAGQGEGGTGGNFVELVKSAIDVYNAALDKTPFVWNALAKVCQYGGTASLLRQILDRKSGLLVWYPEQLDVIGRTTAINAGSKLGLSISEMSELFASKDDGDEQLAQAMLNAFKRALRTDSEGETLMVAAKEIAEKHAGNAKCQGAYLELLTLAKQHEEIAIHFEQVVMPRWIEDNAIPDHLIVAITFTAYLALGRPERVFRTYEALKKDCSLRDSVRIIEMLLRAARAMGKWKRAETVFEQAFQSRYNVERRRNKLLPSERCVFEMKACWREAHTATTTTAAELDKEAFAKRMRALNDWLATHNNTQE